MLMNISLILQARFDCVEKNYHEFILLEFVSGHDLTLKLNLKANYEKKAFTI
jgi:hypothetical protein